MATRVQIDAAGLRVSRPGADANGGPAGLLLDTAIRYGQVLDHILINLNRVQYTGPNTNYGNSLSERIDYCEGRFYYGPYAETPDMMCFGIVSGRYQWPPVDYNGASSIPSWQKNLDGNNAAAYVRFNRANGLAGLSVIMPHQAILILYRKPRLG